MKRLPALLFSTLLAVPSTALAQDVADGWTAKTINMSWTGSGIKKELRGKVFKAEGLYSGTAETPGNVALTCFAKTFAVNIAVEPVDMASMFTGTPDSQRGKLRKPYMRVDGEMIETQDWVYMPAMKIYKSRRKKTAAKIYNAIIRGQTVEMEADGGYQTLNLPPMDDAFKDFGAGCGMGRNRVKS